MDSIFQSKDDDRCYLCGMPENGDHLDWHHVFEGSRRQISEKYGLKVKLHHCQCHQEGMFAVHRSSEVMRALKRHAQRKAMKHYGWTVEEWIEKMGKSYL